MDNGSGGVDDEHGLWLVEEVGIGVGDTGAVAYGTEGVDDGGEGAEDVGNVLSAHSLAGERGMLLTHQLEQARSPHRG